jgi:hypothetical protein
MKFRYTPDAGGFQDFELNADELSTDEAELVEGAGANQWGTFAEWFDLINRGGWRAWRVALWVMLLRSNPDLGFEEVKPNTGQLVFNLVDIGDIDERAEGEPGKSEPPDDATDST